MRLRSFNLLQRPTSHSSDPRKLKIINGIYTYTPESSWLGIGYKIALLLKIGPTGA